MAARTTVPLLRELVGAHVLVVYEQNDILRPIIIGVLQDCQAGPVGGNSQRHSVAVQADADRYVISADREIVLRCGEASITLTRAGKIIIKGTYIVSRSAGCNKIKGAVVDIN